MAIAAIVNKSGLATSGKSGGPDSALASFAFLAAMRRILAADSPPYVAGAIGRFAPTVVFALRSSPGEQFWLRKGGARFGNFEKHRVVISCYVLRDRLSRQAGSHRGKAWRVIMAKVILALTGAAILLEGSAY